jgi:hypothetical protein
MLVCSFLSIERKYFDPSLNACMIPNVISSNSENAYKSSGFTANMSW